MQRKCELERLSRCGGLDLKERLTEGKFSKMEVEW